MNVMKVRIPLCPPELISLYFEESTEIQAFLLPTENSFNCIFAAPCDCFTVEKHTKSHEIYWWYKAIKETSSRKGAGYIY